MESGHSIDYRLGTRSDLESSPMPQMTCPVGHSFSEGLIPSPHRSYLVSDVGLESLVARLIEAAKGDDPEVQLGVAIIDSGNHAYVCPTCDRLFIVDPALNQSIASYVGE